MLSKGDIDKYDHPTICKNSSKADKQKNVIFTWVKNTMTRRIVNALSTEDKGEMQLIPMNTNNHFAVFYNRKKQY